MSKGLHVGVSHLDLGIHRGVAAEDPPHRGDDTLQQRHGGGELQVAVERCPEVCSVHKRLGVLCAVPLRAHLVGNEWLKERVIVNR